MKHVLGGMSFPELLMRSIHAESTCLLQGHQVRILTYFYKIKSFLSWFVLSIKSLNEKVILSKSWVVHIEDTCFFRWKVEMYFIEWTPLVIFSRVAQPRVKILPMVFTRWNEFRSFTEKKSPKYSVYFMFLTLSGRSFIKIQYILFRHFPWRTPSA